MKTIYLHIGYPKTATTTLQNDVFTHCRSLCYLGKIKNKVPYLPEEGLSESIAPTILYDLYMNNPSFHSNLSQYRQQINSIEAERLLLSDENIIQLHTAVTPLESILANIRLLFENCHIKLLVTIRQQASLIESIYNQGFMNLWRKIKALNTLDKYVDSVVNTNITTNKYNFDYLIGYFAQELGQQNILVLPYELLARDTKQFLAELASFLEAPELRSLAESIGRHNQRFSSVGHHDYTLWQWLLDIKQRITDRSVLPPKLRHSMWNLLKTIKFRSVKDYQFSLSPEQQEQVRQFFRESNRALSEKYQLDLDSYGYF